MSSLNQSINLFLRWQHYAKYNSNSKFTCYFSYLWMLHIVLQVATFLICEYFTSYYRFVTATFYLWIHIVLHFATFLICECFTSYYRFVTFLICECFTSYYRFVTFLICEYTSYYMVFLICYFSYLWMLHIVLQVCYFSYLWIHIVLQVATFLICECFTSYYRFVTFIPSTVHTHGVIIFQIV